MEDGGGGSGRETWPGSSSVEVAARAAQEFAEAIALEGGLVERAPLSILLPYRNPVPCATHPPDFGTIVPFDGKGDVEEILLYPIDTSALLADDDTR